MKTVFEMETAKVSVDSDGEIHVTGKNVTIFTHKVVTAMGAEILRLKKELAEAKKLFDSASRTCIDFLEEKDLLNKKLAAYKNSSQPMATLEHTSEPDLRHYHYYAEHKIENISFDGYLSCTWNGNGEGAGGELVEAVKQSTCELAWQKKMIKSNPSDWVIKSLSRL